MKTLWQRSTAFLKGAYSLLRGPGSAPKGYLGLIWGEDAADAARRLGLQCAAWEAWEGGRGYEACFDIDHPHDVFGHKAYVRLFRSEDRIEGLTLRFSRCGAKKKELASKARRAFRLRGPDGMPYTVFKKGEVVHLSHDPGDDTCELTIAGPRFGRAFADYLLEQGFKNLATGFRAR